MHFSELAIKFPKVSIVIPARNEEKNLPVLLKSIAEQKLNFVEVIVANDSSTDDTKKIAQEMGAIVVDVPLLESGWTGKTWALQNGAKAATGEILFFVDADTFFENHALQRILSIFLTGKKTSAISIIPFHKMNRMYENFSLFFNILMCLGTDSFLFKSKKHQKARLVGQSLVIAKDTFYKVGAYEKVKGLVLENFFLSEHLQAQGVHCTSILGKGLLSFRMYAEGLQQLFKGWKKAFSKGTKGVSQSTMLLSVLWLFGCVFVMLALLLSIPFSFDLWPSLLAYLILALNLFWMSRKIGNYSFAFSLFYPIPLAFYFFVFFSSIFKWGASAEWKGRQV